PHIIVCQAPQVFMTDNLSADKAVLHETWPTARHLLCHFHVAEAEWRWLTAAHNGVHKDQRYCLMSAFHRVASHQVVYKRLISKMLQGAAESIQPQGDKLYAVPSATLHDVVYGVAADFGACSCPVGKQGAFCKHKALVHETFGGWFPNAPPLTTEDWHRLGKLVLGDKCPPWECFRLFRGEQQYPGEEDSPRRTPEAPKGPDNAGATDLLEADDQPEAPQPSTSALAPTAAQDPDQAQRAQAREEMYRCLESRMRRLHAMNEDNPAYIELLDGLGDRMDRVTNGNDAYGLMLTLKSAAGVRQRRGRRIRVQPTRLARRRPGLTRGSKRVPAGRPSGQPSAKRPRKRPQSLQMSVRDNVPSAGLH
ncbi:unnamed protein product, partial [Ixodes hexagonus]